jgi:hypothetical protein
MIQELTKKVRKIIHGDDYEEKLEKGCHLHRYIEGMLSSDYLVVTDFSDTFIFAYHIAPAWNITKYKRDENFLYTKNLGKPLETREVLLAISYKSTLDFVLSGHTDNVGVFCEVTGDKLVELPLKQKPKEWSEEVLQAIIDIVK